MILLAYLISYLGIAVFVIAILARVVMWVRMPIHLRWELYPVAHEVGKAHYGGSYLEDSEWWTKPRQSSLLGELKVMIPEILFLVALREHNRKMWRCSFPFHFGLYLVVACTALMVMKAVVGVFAPGLSAAAWGSIPEYAVVILGTAGLTLGILGALGLLFRRIGVWELRDYSVPADFFNLLVFVLVFGVALTSFLVIDPGFFRGVEQVIANLLTLNPAPAPGPVVISALPLISAVLMSMLLAYVPLTHMSHFVGKYFAYHSIRWNDEPNLPGGKQEEKIKKLLSQAVSWSAPHIQGKGKKTWVDLASHVPEDEEPKK